VIRIHPLRVVIRKKLSQPFVLKALDHCPSISRSVKRTFTHVKCSFTLFAGRMPEAVIREYIKKQEREDSRLDQMNLWR
jgi:hypothetical protein